MIWFGETEIEIKTYQPRSNKTMLFYQEQFIQNYSEIYSEILLLFDYYFIILENFCAWVMLISFHDILYFWEMPSIFFLLILFCRQMINTKCVDIDMCVFILCKEYSSLIIMSGKKSIAQYTQALTGFFRSHILSLFNFL